MEKLIIKYVNELSQWLTKENPKHHIQWTAENSLFYFLKIDEFNVYIEIFFVNDDRDDIEELEDGVETVVNIFKNKEHELAYAGTLKECLAQIKKIKI